MSAPIEVPLTLLQVPIKTIWFDPVEMPLIALSVVPETLDSVDVVSFF
jgi:hypothetical protein